jgi:predicted nucleic acid-binding protein
VKVIVDANIVFSGILNSNGKIGDLLINSKKHLDFIAPDFLRTEISKHINRLCRISGLTPTQVSEAEFQICKDITFISEEQIRPSAWIAAEKLTGTVDPKDTHYIAYSKHFRCKIWSGDKKLINGLSRKGFKKFMSTDELYKWRQSIAKR